MTQRHQRSGMRDPVGFFESLRSTRDACVQQLRDLPPTGPHYMMMQVLIAAFDVSAEFFTRQRGFYTVGRGDMDQIGARYRG